MTQKVKEMAPKIWEAIQKSNNVLLHFHPSPDPDTVGCSLTMLQVLEELGKKVTLIKGDSDLPVWVTKLPGSEKIVQKNYFEIDPKEFDLFLIMDSSTPDMVSKIAPMEFPETMTTVVIDHHTSNEGFGKINLIDPTYIANCELLYDLIKEWGVEVKKDMAGCLMLGIYADSGGFKYPMVDSQTFFVAAELSKIDPEYHKYIFELENNEDSRRIKYLGLALSSIRTYFNGKVAIVSLSLEDLRKNGLDVKDTEKSIVSNTLKSVVGWDLGINFTEIEPGISSMSFRTRSARQYDLSQIAKVLGGGGHKGAAGAQIKMPFEEAKKYLLEKLAETYPDLGQP